MTIESVLSSGPMSRRGVIAAIGAAGATLAIPGSALGGMLGKKNLINDVDILNFALNLEYLEAEFYSYATTGHGISPTLFTGLGNEGPTTGGKMVNFANAHISAIATEIALDELHHVEFLRSALGPDAVAKPEIKLNALGIGFGGPTEFLTLARAFEDVGVSAYGGAARYISNPDYLEAAARILATEAYHAGNIRDEIAKPTPGFAVDAMDQPPTTTNHFPTDGNSLAIIRTTDQVAMIVRGPSPSGGNFFPNGLNGNIR